jgi:hypothetical protein
VGVTLALALGCGTSRTGSSESDEGTDTGESSTPAVQVCKPAAATRLSLMADEVSYTKDLYPIMNTDIVGNQPRGHCSQCHSGNNDDRPNSTNCLYLAENIDNVLARLNNAREAKTLDIAIRADLALDPNGPLAAGFTGDEADNNAVNTFVRTQVQAAFAADEQPMPRYPFDDNRQPLTTSQILLFTKFKDVADKCSQGEPGPEFAEIPVPDAFSDAEAGALPGEGDVAQCDDGPAVNTEDNWALMGDLLEAEEEPASSFYDYETKEYVDGAAAASFECTWDNFIASLPGVAGFAETMGAYRDYGWRILNCSVVDGLPRASMATLSRITATNGDASLALNWKAIALDRGDTGTTTSTDTATGSATSTDTAAEEGAP